MPLTLKICPFCRSGEPVVQFVEYDGVVCIEYDDDVFARFLQLVCSVPERGCGAHFEKRLADREELGPGTLWASEADREELAAKWNRRCSDVVGSRT